MVRGSKTSSSEKQVVASVPVVDASVVQKPKATKKAAKAASSEPVKEAPVVAPVVVETPVAEVAEVSDASTLSAKLSEYGAKLQQLVSLVSLVKNEYKVLEKSVVRELKNAQKASSKKKRTSGNRAPSGFIKPTLISDELASFLGKPTGTQMARTEVSKEINGYIRSNSLQDKTNGRKIIPDLKLAELLKMKSDDDLTYFNLQRYMKHHFIKAEPVATA